MGGQGAVLPVVALGGDPGLDAGPLLRPLADDPHRLRGHVLGDDVGVGAGVAVLGHGVAHGENVAHVPAGVAPAVVGVRQLVHAVLGGGVLRQAQKLLQGGHGGLLVLLKLVGPAVVDDDGQPVPPFLAPLLQKVYDLHNGDVALVVVHVQGVVHHVVHRPVPGQHLAVPVQNLPPGGGDLDGVRAAAQGDALVLLPVHNLPLEQPHLVAQEHGHQQHHAQSVAAKFWKLRYFHRQINL